MANEPIVDEIRLVQLFRELLGINAPPLRESAVVTWTQKYLADFVGLEVWQDHAGDEIGGDANNLIARLPGNLPGAPRIFFSAHFDTVEPTEGLEIGEKDGVFYSISDTILGADDKAGMAPAIEAVHAIRDSGEPHGDVYLLLSVAEEIGLRGAKAMRLEDLNLDFGYVLDTGPPVGSFVTRSATHDRLEVLVHGKPAHAGKDPENGINAMQVAAEAIHGMCLGRIDAGTTANLGIIEGGTAVNVVCPFVRIRAEARSTSKETLDGQIAHMIGRFEATAQKWNTTVEIEHARHYEAYVVDEESPVVRVAQEASRALGMDPALRTTLGGSDANVFNAKGLSSIVVATGMDHIHTHDEVCSREDLVNTARLCVELIRQAARLGQG